MLRRAPLAGQALYGNLSAGTGFVGLISWVDARYSPAREVSTGVDELPIIHRDPVCCLAVLTKGCESAILVLDYHQTRAAIASLDDAEKERRRFQCHELGFVERTGDAENQVECRPCVNLTPGDAAGRLEFKCDPETSRIKMHALFWHWIDWGKQRGYWCQLVCQLTSTQAGALRCDLGRCWDDFGRYALLP